MRMFYKNETSRTKKEFGVLGKNTRFFPNNPGRYDHFVLIPKVPEFPLEHAGVLADGQETLAYHKERGLSSIDQDLIRLGQNTIALLSKQNCSVCPRVIFFGLTPPTYPGISQEILTRSDVVKRNKNLYSGHFLNNYSPSFRSERQKKDLYLDIASHGNSQSIGSSMYWINDTIADLRLEPDVFTECLLGIVDDALSSAPSFHPTIHITFYSCNSAYCSFPENTIDNRALLDQCVIDETFIGKVATSLHQFNIKGTVTGFRGFYRTRENGAGAVVCSTNNLNSNLYEEVRADNMKFTINVSQEEGVVVSHVPNKRHLKFRVYLPEEQSKDEIDLSQNTHRP